MTDGAGKLWARDADQIYEHLYHHFHETGFNRLEIRNGEIFLKEFNGDRGWYVTGNKIDNQLAAKEILQLPELANGRYRCKFTTAQVRGNLKVPTGNINEAGKSFEPLAKEFPANGPGGGTQFLLERSGAFVDEIFDTIEGRSLSIQEVINLINHE